MSSGIGEVATRAMGVARYGAVRDVRGRIHLTTLKFRHQELRGTKKKKGTKTLSGGVHGNRVRMIPDIPDDGRQRCGADHAGVASAIGYFVIF
jgi:alanyl-tRNA synthetase